MRSKFKRSFKKDQNYKDINFEKKITKKKH